MVRMRSIIGAGIVLALGALWMGCRRGPEVPDTSHIVLDNRLYRIDTQMRHLMHYGLDSLAQWVGDRPTVWQLLCVEIIGLEGMPSPEDTAFVRSWRELSRDTVFRMLSHKIDSLYADFGPYFEAIRKALRLYKYYFPRRTVPDIYTTNTNLGVAQFVFRDRGGRDALGIGLDFYLGEAFPYVQLSPVNPLFSRYLSRFFHRGYLVRDALWAIVDDLVGEPSGQRLLDRMIHEGKKLYIMEKLLPDLPDSILIKYTPEQMAWCRANRADIWSYFVAEKLLYEVSYQRIRSYVADAPFSVGMPRKSPSRTGSWIGWQIVRAYMRRHPEVSLEQFVQLRDADALLRESRFKP